MQRVRSGAAPAKLVELRELVCGEGRRATQSASKLASSRAASVAGGSALTKRRSLGGGRSCPVSPIFMGCYQRPCESDDRAALG